MFHVQNYVNGMVFLPGERMPGFTHVYAYWPLQVSDFGDHWYPTGDGFGWKRDPGLYPDFHPLPNVNVALGQWFCYELMVRMNDLGARNGEVKGRSFKK
jgi:hypothetical protein